MLPLVILKKMVGSRIQGSVWKNIKTKVNLERDAMTKRRMSSTKNPKTTGRQLMTFVIFLLIVIAAVMPTKPLIQDKGRISL
jgi:hypothetical protein